MLGLFVNMNLSSVGGQINLGWHDLSHIPFHGYSSCLQLSELIVTVKEAVEAPLRWIIQSDEHQIINDVKCHWGECENP